LTELDKRCVESYTESQVLIQKVCLLKMILLANDEREQHGLCEKI